jgi:diacylglycerol kinase family enzyme
MKVAVILNCAAGIGEKEGIPQQVLKLFREHGVEPKIFVTEKGEKLIPYAKETVAGDFDMIVAGGGDGSLNAVASVIAGSRKAFGVLALGTMNHFAKDLQLPLDLEEAVANVVSGIPRDVDIAEVNGQSFINNSGIGLYPKIVEDRKHQQRLGAKKWTAFFRAFLKILSRYPFVTVRIETAEQPEDVEGQSAPKEMIRRSPMVFVGNNIYDIHGFDIGSRKRLDEGKLCLFVTKRVGRLALAWLGIRGLLGLLNDAEDFDSLTATKFSIESNKHELEVSLDGEVVRLKPPLIYTIHPRALRVICPSNVQKG